MKLTPRVLWAMIAVSLMLALAGTFAIARQHREALASVTDEAEDVARVLGLLLTSGAVTDPGAAQRTVERLHQTLGRDVVLLDTSRKILADAVPSEVGTLFAHDGGGEVAASLLDRRTRTFVETSPAYPTGIRQMVVPVSDPAGVVVGAVVLEYTKLHEERMRGARESMWQLALASLGGILVAVGLALYVKRRIATPLERLTQVATQFASGRTDLPAPTSHRDELGAMTTAFIHMVERRQQIEAELTSLKDGLEARVATRTSELAGANLALREEVAVRQAAEGRLQDATDRLQRLIAASPAVIYSLDILGEQLALTWISENLTRFTGHTPAEALAPTWWMDRLHPDDRERVLAEHVLPFPGDRILTEYRFARKDGSYAWFRDEKTLLRDAAGAPKGVVGLWSDIDARKGLEDAMRRQQTEFRVLFDLIPAMIWFKDTKNGIVRVNQRVAALAGKRVDEIEGRATEEIYPDDAARFHADDLVVIRSGMPKLGFVETIRDAEGAERWVQTDKVPYRDATGEVVGIVVVAQDVTERRKAEDSVRLLGSAVEQSGESILLMDARRTAPGPRIVFVNPAFTRMTGYAASEAIGRTPRMLQGPRTDRTVLRRFRRCLLEGVAFEGETVNYRKDGTEFTVEWRVAPLRDATGRITNFVAVQRDTTTHRRLEAQLIQSQKLETVGRLAGGVAHEFNSILTAILGQSELLIEDLPSGSPLLKNATEIRQAAGRAAKLTAQLLAYGRKQVLHTQSLDLNQVLRGMRGVFEHLMSGGVEVHVIEAAGLEPVMADVGQIEQVVMNLVMNARDAMPNGGKLIVETANITFGEDGVGRPQGLKPGEYVMLAITDTGVGMTDEVKARLFEPFFTTKAVGEGSGLGLSTCYGIVKQSGGHLSAYSEVSRGTTFKVYLPQAERLSGPPLSRLGAAAMPRGSETILLVEDDPALREMASSLLRRLGYTVVSAANGVDALGVRQRREVGHVDLLFTDVVMPHMSGTELAERVRALDPSIRILFTSAQTQSSAVHQGVLRKGVSLLQKPYAPSTLALRLRELLDAPSGPQTGDGRGAPEPAIGPEGASALPG